MSFSVAWHEQEINVITLRLGAPWDVAELEKAIHIARKMARAVPGDVYGIVYAEGNDFGLPRSLRPSKLAALMQDQSPRALKKTFVIARKHIYYFFNMVFTIHPELQDYVRVVDTWEDAIQSIQAAKAMEKEPERSLIIE